jgi:hypothetical protein
MPSTKSLLAGGAAVAILVAAPPAGAAESVYGGSTNDGEPIVLKADAKAKTLSSAVIGWHAKCGDGMYFPGSTELSATFATPGFSPGYRDLMMSRNAGGRFAGTQLGAGSVATAAMSMVVDLAGKLAPTRASGTLHAVVKIMDPATGAAITSCDTGVVRYVATRAPGTIYAGRTSQEEPVVVRVDVKRRAIADLLANWRTSTCTPDALYRYPERLKAFPLKRTGAFGDTWTGDYPIDGGGKRTFAYQLGGRVTRTTTKGTLHVTMNDTDAAGTQTLSCDSGGIAFKATTG